MLQDRIVGAVGLGSEALGYRLIEISWFGPVRYSLNLMTFLNDDSLPSCRKLAGAGTK